MKDEDLLNALASAIGAKLQGIDWKVQGSAHIAIIRFEGVRPSGERVFAQQELPLYVVPFLLNQPGQLDGVLSALLAYYAKCLYLKDYHGTNLSELRPNV